MSEIPSELKYTKEHEWVRQEDGKVRVGVTAYAVEQLGDIAHVELPAVGETLSANDRFGDIESVKTVSELFAPVSGKVVEANGGLEDSPELVNDEPYGEGWMLLIEPEDASALDSLMSAQDYTKYLAEIAE